MSRVAINSVFSLSRRTYSVTAETARVTLAAALPRVVGTAKSADESVKEDVFWMRDPKTGYWIPENRFQDADPAELRAKLLSKK